MLLDRREWGVEPSLLGENGAQRYTLRRSNRSGWRAAIYGKIFAVAIVSVAALLAACGDQDQGPAEVPAGASVAAAATTPTSQLAAPAPTASAVSSDSPAATPEPTSPTASPDAMPLAEVPSEATAKLGTTVTFTADSVARYRINEQLARLSLPTEAVGETRDIEGSIVLSADGVVERDASTIRIGLASLRSDEGRRDGYVRDRTLSTREFPDATVAVSEAFRGRCRPPVMSP